MSEDTKQQMIWATALTIILSVLLFLTARCNVNITDKQTERYKVCVESTKSAEDCSEKYPP